MTKTEQPAEKCADKKAMHEAEYHESYIAIKDAYRNGAQDMLERVCEWLKFNTNWDMEWDDFGKNIDFGKIDELRKDMEE